MSSVWYIGLSDVRTITSANWTAVGAPGSDATWNSANGWSIPTTSFTASQLTYLATQSDFATGQPDGPRTGATLAPIPRLIRARSSSTIPRRRRRSYGFRTMRGPG
jgi:hypothetical protein